MFNPEEWVEWEVVLSEEFRADLTQYVDAVSRRTEALTAVHHLLVRRRDGVFVPKWAPDILHALYTRPFADTTIPTRVMAWVGRPADYQERFDRSEAVLSLLDLSDDARLVALIEAYA